ARAGAVAGSRSCRVEPTGAPVRATLTLREAVPVATPAEPDGGNCTNGGTRVDTGLDDNDNSTLDAGEIDTTPYVCDGAAGSDGTNSNDGTNGTNGLTALVSTSAEPDGGNCTNGGTRVDTVVDATDKSTV